jgi:menaquinone-dependent protoporphyrinogen IX oxidase
MNIGLFVHSQTGHTRLVAERLNERLATAGHSVTLERVEPIGEVKPRTADVKLKAVPDPSKYDAIVIGAPVHAFALSSTMQAYLRQAPSLRDKRVACFVTQSFPFAWMGGRQALRQIQKLCQTRGATVCGSGVVNWSRRSREQQMAQVVDALARCLS